MFVVFWHLYYYKTCWYLQWFLLRPLKNIGACWFLTSRQRKNNIMHQKPVVNLIYCLTVQTVRLRLQFCFFFLVLLSRLASVWFQTGSFKRPASRVSQSFDLYIDRGVHQIWFIFLNLLLDSRLLWFLLDVFGVLEFDFILQARSNGHLPQQDHIGRQHHFRAVDR